MLLPAILCYHRDGKLNDGKPVKGREGFETDSRTSPAFTLTCNPATPRKSTAQNHSLTLALCNRHRKHPPASADCSPRPVRVSRLSDQPCGHQSPQTPPYTSRDAGPALTWLLRPRRAGRWRGSPRRGRRGAAPARGGPSRTAGPALRGESKHRLRHAPRRPATPTRQDKPPSPPCSPSGPRKIGGGSAHGSHSAAASPRHRQRPLGAAILPNRPGPPPEPVPAELAPRGREEAFRQAGTL